MELVSVFVFGSGLGLILGFVFFAVFYAFLGKML